jgi:hypothetical protein
MIVVGLLGFVALILTSFAVGFRLLRLGARTRQIPELMIGGAFVFAGGLPGVLLLIGDDGGTGTYADGRLLAAISLSLLLGVSMLNYFTWRVFRPDERWGTLLFLLLMAGLVVGQGGGALASLEGAPTRAFVWLSVSMRIAAYAWGVTEALLAYVAARRSCALGLTDPLVANRMLLWAIGLAAVMAIWVHEACTLAFGRGPASYLLIAVFGFVCAGSLWLAFVPPASYQRRFARAGEVG